MRAWRRILAVVLGLPILGLAVWFGGLGPVGPLPGGWLWGDVVREPVADWSFTDRIPEVEVQTRLGPLPWSVTTWSLSHDGTLYIPSGDCGRIWTRQVLAHPEVRVRALGRIHEMRAERLTGDALSEALAPIVLHKYLGIAVDSARWLPEQRTGCIFRLEPRS